MLLNERTITFCSLITQVACRRRSCTSNEVIDPRHVKELLERNISTTGVEIFAGTCCTRSQFFTASKTTHNLVDVGDIFRDKGNASAIMTDSCASLPQGLSEGVAPLQERGSRGIFVSRMFTVLLHNLTSSVGRPTLHRTVQPFKFRGDFPPEVQCTFIDASFDDPLNFPFIRFRQTRTPRTRA